MADHKKPCFRFQRGICHYGNKCRYSHEPVASSRKTKLCQYFARGRCLRGDSCQYSHDTSLLESADSDTDDSGQKEPSGPSIHDQLRTWRYDIKQNRRDILRAQPLGRQLSDFIQNALELVNNVGTMQEVIKCLSSEGGLHRLGEMLNAEFSSLNDDRLQVIFKDQLLPFMQIIVHENVLSSAVIESQHATLLNYLFGIDGKRSVAIFSASIRALTYDEKISADLEPCLIALSAVLEVNGSAQVNDDLRAAAETMVALADDRELSGNALRYHRKMCLRLGLGGHIKNAENTKKDTANRPKPKFKLFIDQPGELSERGPRHDNDFEDIENIQIMPTMEEILSDRAEYLPQTDPSTWHWTGVAGLLDRQFRLLREDTVGQLRDAAKVELARIQNPNDRNRPARNSGARTYRYHDVRLADALFDEHKGLLCVLQFAQPQELKGKSAAKRKEWWAESNRLGQDALIMLLGAGQVAIFLTVANTQPPPGAKGVDAINDSLEARFPRAGDENFAQVVVQLVDRTELDIETLLFRAGVNAKRLSFSLLEFPGVLLPAFQHTLAALQSISDSNELPFAGLLAPGEDAQQTQDIEPPAYTKKQGFRYDLSSLSSKNENITMDVAAPIDASALSAQTSLDNAQAEALVSALSRSVALIQGPPGTGKSYTGVALMKVLLANKAAGQLGPILIVTFTNHALDGPLEHAVDAGIKQVIRIGQNSKSEKLANLNLRVVARKEERTKYEKSENWELRQQIEVLRESISDSLDELQAANSETSVMSFLQAEHPEYHSQLVQPEIDPEGFRLVRNWRAPRGLSEWLQGDSQVSSAAHGTRQVDLHTLSSARRQQMYSGWTEQIMEPIRRSLLANLQEYESVKAQVGCIKTEVDLRVLNEANVIGVTTSGLARNLGLLRRLKCKVLIKEEAGEIMEAHSLTAMLPSIEHMILIGDHQQLRPKAQNYDLSCENPRSQTKLDVSMFERLIQPQYEQYAAVPYVALKVQRRMHPSISTLIRNTLYADLEDSLEVANYPEVSGMRRRLFWLDHDQFEDGENDRSDSTSHTNQYEVDMVFALVRHLVRQGVYKATDIAVLTPYLGQLRKLRISLSSFAEVVVNDRDADELALVDDNEDKAKNNPIVDGKMIARPPPKLGAYKVPLSKALRLATIDNFQGEEAKVVIISLVRCNQQRKCGFLRTSNRINVLLSRAQHGMYIVGNSATSSHVAMWEQVLDMLKEGGNIGTQLELCCPRHPDTPLVVTTPDDFSSVSPEAGCDLLCGKRLPCGHSCVNKCHSDGLHNAVYCLKECNRVKEGCSHNCQYECGRQCDEKCNIEVSNIDVELLCGHRVKKLPCWQYQDPSQVKCRVLVERQVPGCDHTITMACHRSIDDPHFICNAVCGALQPCGHSCTSKCFKCRPREMHAITKEEHPTCEQQCGRVYTNCRHSCTKPCHGDEACQLCEQACDVQCSHAKCTKKCSEPCTPCAEEGCASCCPRAKCSMPCAAPCDWVPCSERCKKSLACGHQCPSVCGADCPSKEYCQICGSDTIKDIRADLIELTTYSNVDLSESPCVFLPCGHIFTVESLDGVMAMSDYYEIDAMTGMPTAIKGNSSDPSSEEMKNCPDCRSSLRLLPRYGRVVRRALLDESTKKFISWSNRQYLELAEPMQNHQELLMRWSLTSVLRLTGNVSLDASSSHLLKLYRLARVGNRYRPLFALQQKINSFINKTAATEQPFRRVHDIVEALRRRRLDAGETVDAFDFDQTLLQTRGNLLATALAIRCEVIAVSDFIKVFDTRKRLNDPFTLKVDFSHNRESCQSLISLSTATHSPLQQTEGHIFWAQFAALECLVIESNGDGSRTKLLADIKAKAEEHLKLAKELCATFPRQTSSVSAEVDDVGRLLRDSGYRSEMKMIVAAMQSEFSGTGHWYRCENGHPFTIGECGMPMQTARCPQCNAPIGGQNHQAAAGVQHAGDIEREFGDLRIRG